MVPSFGAEWTSDSYMHVHCARSEHQILICTLNVRETSDDWQTGICNICCTSRGFCRGCPWDLENCIVIMSAFVCNAVDLCDTWHKKNKVHSKLHCSVCMSMRQWCLHVKRRSRGLRLRRTNSWHWIVRVCSRLVHEVVEVTKLLGSLYLCDACNLQHLAICVGNLYIIMQCNSNTTAFDGARYTKVETTQRCCCLDECRSMTEYGPELKLFVLKSSMSWHCFVLKSSMSWHCFEIKRTDMHVSEFLNAKCLVQVTHPWRLWTFCGRCFICWRECPCEWSMRPRRPRRPMPWKFGCRSCVAVLWPEVVNGSRMPWQKFLSWSFAKWHVLGMLAVDRTRSGLRLESCALDCWMSWHHACRFGGAE